MGTFPTNESKNYNLPTCRIYWFAHASASNHIVRLRGMNMLHFLEDHYDAQVKFFSPPKSTFERLSFLFNALLLLLNKKNHQKIVVQQVVDRSFYSNLLLLLARSRKDVIFDVDRSFEDFEETNRFESFIDHAQMVLCGNQEILKLMQQRGKRAFFLPTPVLNQHSVSNPNNGKFTLGWFIGNKSPNELETTMNTLLFLVLPLVKKLKMPLKLEVIGQSSKHIQKEIEDALIHQSHLQFSCTFEQAIAPNQKLMYQLGQWDAAICPQLTEFSATHLNAHLNRIVLSAGVPIFVSTNCEQSKLIVNGSNGWKCDSLDDFVGRMKSFLSLTKQEKLRMRENAVQSVACWSAWSTAQRFAEWIQVDVNTKQKFK